MIDKSCISTLDFFSNIEVLQKKKIKKDLIILKPSPFIFRTPIALFLIPPSQESLQEVEEQIRGNSPKPNTNDTNMEEKDFHIIIVSGINNECRDFIEKSGFKEKFHIHNLPIDIYPLDYDIISLEDNNILRKLYVDGDLTALSAFSKAIIKLESIFGKIHQKFYKGDFSSNLFKLLEQEENIYLGDFSKKGKEIDACVMIDRGVDFITAFCTQATYQGVLDEYFGISYNSIKVKPSILEKESKAEKIKLDLSHKDKFYQMIKDYNFNKLRMFLPDRLSQHSRILAEGKNSTDLKEIQKSLKKVKMLKEERPSLTNHINLADYIVQQQKVPQYRLTLQFEQNLLIGELPSKLHDYYDSQINLKGDKFKLLKLICLESLIQCGIKGKIYDKLKRDFLNTYGFQEIFLINSLEKMKILKKQNSEYSYDYLNSKMKLICETVDINEPNDAAYSFGGYCPITIRLIEQLITRGWKKSKDALKYTPGGEYFYPEEEEFVGNEDQIILLVFVGGITYGEISAIRYLNKVSKVKFIILTSGIVNAKRILDVAGKNSLLKENVFTIKEFYTQIDALN